MALKDTDITALITHYSHHIVTTSSYEQLKEHLLQRKALPLITESAEQVLGQYCLNDKQECQGQLTAQACEQQRISDEQEAVTDERDRQSDEHLSTQYQHELPALSAQLSTLNSQVIAQNSRCLPFQSIHDQLQSQKSGLDQQLASIAHQKLLLTNQNLFHSISHHSHHSDYNHHGRHSSHGHGHHHNPVVTMHHPRNIDLYDITSQIQLTSLKSQESQLLREQSALQREIDNNNSNLHCERNILSELQRAQRTAQSRQQFITNELDKNLPLKITQRKHREEERNLRESARRTPGTELAQLSQQNQTALKQRITTQHRALDKLKEDLMRQIDSSSYAVFMNYLDSSLLMTNLMPLGNSQKEALKTISKLMKDYSAAEATRNELSARVQQENQRLTEIKRNQQSNVVLENTNKQLVIQGDAVSKKRNIASFFGATGIAGAIVFCVLIPVLALNPLLWCIPAALALFGTIAFTVALVSHKRKTNRDNEIARNERTISSNIAAHLDGKFHNTNNARPSLGDQILTQEQQVGKAQTALEQCEESMRLIHGKANNVKCDSHAMYPELMFMPSAPPFNMDYLGSYLQPGNPTF